MCACHEGQIEDFDGNKFFFTATGGEHPYMNFIDWAFGSQNYILHFQHLGKKNKGRGEYNRVQQRKRTHEQIKDKAITLDE